MTSRPGIDRLDAECRADIAKALGEANATLRSMARITGDAIALLD
jgi:hypothetical protein